MKRRTFTRLAGTGMVIPVIWPNFKWPYADDHTSDLVDRLLAINDARIPALLSGQQKDKTHKWFGGIESDTEVYYPGHAASFIKSLTCAYVSPGASFYQSRDLLEAMVAATEYLLRSQHDDGNIDLPSTNFRSPPDTAFVVEPLCISYSLLSDIEKEELKSLKSNLRKFLAKAGEALTVGGIHTANHRWVVSMALARLNALFPNEQYIHRIAEWLAERIDIDPDGQYAERSALIYTPLVNRCLITIARLTNKPELFEPVRRNLEMTLYYIHANGEIVTETSGRQDQHMRGTMENYLFAYRYMAILDGNGEFATMSEEIQKLEPGKLLYWLGYFLEDDLLSEPLPSRQPLPDNYVQAFYHSNLVRIRRGSMDATILSDNPIFLTFFKGNAALEAVRLSSAFFGKGQFKGQTLERSENSFIMRQKLIGPYYQPLEKEDIPEDGNGWQVSRIKRRQTEVQVQETVVSVSEIDGRIEINIQVSGTEDVPVAVELAFRQGGRLKGVTGLEGIEHAYLPVENEMMEYTFEGDTITFGPGIRGHAWTQLRGALPKLDAECVYFTGFAPWDIRINIF